MSTVTKEKPNEVDFDHAIFLAGIKKTFGSEAVVSAEGFSPYSEDGMHIPTGAETLNDALGIGGIPRGRIIEIFGPESGGKSSMCLDIARAAQQMFPDKPVVYIDVEQTLNLEYARSVGVNLDKEHFILFQMSITEEVLEIADRAATAGASVVIVDSVPAMTLKKDMEEGLSTEDRVGGSSKALRSHLKRMNDVLRESKTVAIYVNQITYKIGVMHGSAETTPGGTGLKFYASIRLDVRPAEKLVDKTTGEVLGQSIIAKVIKNKLAPPYRQAKYDISFGHGIDRIASIIDACLEVNIVTGKGTAWLKFGELKFNGRKDMIETVTDDRNLESQLRAAIALHRKEQRS